MSPSSDMYEVSRKPERPVADSRGSVCAAAGGGNGPKLDASRLINEFVLLAHFQGHRPRQTAPSLAWSANKGVAQTAITASVWRLSGISVCGGARTGNDSGQGAAGRVPAGGGALSPKIPACRA